MDEMPTIHRRSGFTSEYSTRLKQALLGSRRIDRSVLCDAFPTHLDEDMKMGVVPRENVLSSSYHFEKSYFVKVITKRHLKLHSLLTWWRNRVFQIGKVGKPFASFDTPMEMAEYEFEAAELISQNTGGIATPHKVTSVLGDESIAVILYDFVANTGQIPQSERTLKQFEHVIVSLKQLHENGYVHSSVADHIIRQIPDGEPYLIGPTGRTKDKETHELSGVGFDIASALVRYSPVIGTLPALNVVDDHYTDLDLIATYEATTVTPVLIPGTSPWVIKQVQSSIDEFVDDRSIDDFIQKTRDEDVNMNSSLLEEVDNRDESNGDGDGDGGGGGDAEEDIMLGEYDDATPINYQ